MQELKDILATPTGVDFLAAHDIFVTHEDFAARLQAPVQAGLTTPAETVSSKPVYALQQIYIDCTQSMLDRMASLAHFEQHADCAPFFLWIDTDLAGTDALMLRFFWPLFEKKVSVRLSGSAHNDRELRFIPIETDKIHQALDKLNIYLSQSITGRKKVTRAKAQDRYEQLKAAFLQQTTGQLSELNQRVTYFLLHRQAGFNPAPMLVSDLLERHLITAEINACLNHLDAIIRVFNTAVEALRARDIDPKVKPLTEDYLPLHLTCTDCHRRLRLRRDRQGSDHFAVARCRCQREYRLHLGSQQLSIDAIVHAGSWSPDVCLTLFLNDFVSGYIAGGSSGVYYGLIMKEVLETVLHKRRVPILLPPPTGGESNATERFDSLLYRYLMDVGE